MTLSELLYSHGYTHRDGTPRKWKCECGTWKNVDPAYVYEEADGTPLAAKVKKACDHGEKSFWWLPYCDGRYDFNAQVFDTRKLPLYDLPLLLAGIECEEVVFVVEGEKDAETLKRLGKVATSHPHGSVLSQWEHPRVDVLRDAREVILIPDEDEAGLPFMQRGLEVLVNARIWRVPFGKDVSEYIELREKGRDASR